MGDYQEKDITIMSAAEQKLTDAEIIAAELGAKKAGERIKWLYETYGDRVMASTSFGLQAAVMLHLISENAPKMPIAFVDTGYLFPETYRYAEALENQLGMKATVYSAQMTPARQEALLGRLWEKGVEKHLDEI